MRVLGGGNPFHHHQNIPRLRRALARVDTIVVHDPYWTAMAKHADIVVPSTTAYEREDYSGSRNDPLLVAMPALTQPYADSRDDYATFSALAERLGFGEEFTEGRTARQWLVHMYEKWSAGLDFEVPGFDEFWAAGHLRLPTEPGLTLLPISGPTRSAPTGHPSGRIEIFSHAIDGFGYDDCAATPVVRADGVARRRARPDLSVASAGQPTRHPPAQPTRRRRHQPVIESPRARTDPDPPRRCGGPRTRRRRRGAGVQRPRACLAGVVIDDRLRPAVVQLSTGAWFDPADPADPDAMCVHGNPNVLTGDVGTSSLARGCTGAHVLVQIEKFAHPLPPVRAHRPPVIRTR